LEARKDCKKSQNVVNWYLMKEEEKAQNSPPAHSVPAETKKSTVVHAFDTKKSTMDKKVFIILFAVVLLGGLTGVFLASIGGGSGSTSGSSDAPQTVKEAAEKGSIIGAKEEGSFKDQAEGVLKEGGIDGEGAYHLERPGGISQNVYLTSSIIDLSEYIDRKVKVWGETNAAKSAGWLMDVGRLQILE